MKPNFTLVLMLSLLVGACGGAQTTPPDTVADPADPCPTSACGPALGMPVTLCDDGVTQGGPTGACEPDGAGACQWEVRECPPPVERSCGGMVPVGQANSCREGEFCDYARDAICGAADASGVCRARPEMCTEEYAPVCGCNDQTYPNACHAAREGIAVSADGECPQRVAAAGETCGTRGALPCGEGLFCDFPAGADCGRADAPGTCAPVPSECPANVRRVCGCDGTTYANACAANLASVSVEFTRACRPAR